MSDKKKTTNGGKDAYLTGKLLLAMPAMGDPRFHRAVIFMCAHSEDGAMGLVINHGLPGVELEQLLEQLGMTSDIQIDLKQLSLPLLAGGPVDSVRGFLLHSGEFSQADTVKINEFYSITGTIEALRDVARGNGPENVLFILGYAGWGPGQLEHELQDNAWLVTEPDSKIIFGIPNDEKWEKAVQKLGFEPGMLSGAAGHA